VSPGDTLLDACTVVNELILLASRSSRAGVASWIVVAVDDAMENEKCVLLSILNTSTSVCPEKALVCFLASMSDARVKV